MIFGFNGPSGLIVFNLRDSDQGDSVTPTLVLKASGTHLVILNLRDSDQGQSMTLTFGTQSFMYSFN